MIRAYPRRAFLLWLALHVFIAAVSGGNALAFGTEGMLVLGVVAGAVGYADTSRRHELRLLGNLGISEFIPSAIWAATIMLLEIVLRIVIASVGMRA
ncbi:MAG: hypothetical protein ACRD3J_16075 [Thermoanaerobaculia bacterium]